MGAGSFTLRIEPNDGRQMFRVANRCLVIGTTQRGDFAAHLQPD
jgi:hypothetical protein